MVDLAELVEPVKMRRMAEGVWVVWLAAGGKPRCELAAQCPALGDIVTGGGGGGGGDWPSVGGGLGGAGGKRLQICLNAASTQCEGEMTKGRSAV